MKPLRSIVTRMLCCLALALPALGQAADPPAPQTATPVEAKATASAGTPHAAIPFKQDKQATDTLAYQSFAALVLVGLAAYGIVFGLKRFRGMAGGPQGKVRRVRTLEAIRLGKSSMLYVVEYHGRELLLAENEHGVQLLISAPPATSPGASMQAAGPGGADV